MRIRAFVLIGLLGTAMSSGACVVAPRTTGSAAPPPVAEYRLAPPDELTIVVRGVEPIIERTVAIRPDGKISFDLIGEADVLGKSVAQVRSEISDRLKEFIVAPDVTVLLDSSNSRRYYVLGEVNRIGAFELIGEVTAVEALASAGGPTLLSSPNGAWLARPGGEAREVYRIRFDDIARGDGATNYALQPGDVIYVPPGATAQIGQAIQVLFYPLQQILGLGGRFYRPL